MYRMFSSVMRTFGMGIRENMEKASATDFNTANMPPHIANLNDAPSQTKLS
jgi:hypothetical protein